MRNYVLGGAQFGLGYGFYQKNPELKDSQIRNLLDYSLSIGVSEIDLAQSYIGVYEKLQNQEKIASFKIATKIQYSDSGEGRIERELVSSLEKLNKSSFSRILIHNWHALNDFEKIEGLTFMNYLRDRGITEHIGVSVYETSEVISQLENVNVIQAPLNFFNTSFLDCQKSRILQDRGVEFQARSIFHQGTLLKPELIFGRFPKEVAVFRTYCDANSFTYLESALSIFDKQNLFKTLVVGVTSELQFQEIVQIGNLQDLSINRPKNLTFPVELTDPRLWE